MFLLEIIIKTENKHEELFILKWKNQLDWILIVQKEGAIITTVTKRVITGQICTI